MHILILLYSVLIIVGDNKAGPAYYPCIVGENINKGMPFGVPKTSGKRSRANP